MALKTYTYICCTRIYVIAPFKSRPTIIPMEPAALLPPPMVPFPSAVMDKTPATSETQPSVPVPCNNDPPAQTKVLQIALPLILQLGFSAVALVPAAGSGSHKRVFILYTLAMYIYFILAFVLVSYLVALLTGIIKPPISNTANRIMWATLAWSFFTFSLGTGLNLAA